MKVQKKIMVVDDETAFCEVLQDFLHAKGYQVVVANSGEEALEKYLHENPDLVLLDVRMPGKDGVWTLREIKALDPEAVVIMVTVVQEKGLYRLIKDEGALDYLTKPLNLYGLELAIRTRITLRRNALESNALRNIPKQE